MTIRNVSNKYHRNIKIIEEMHNLQTSNKYHRILPTEMSKDTYNLTVSTQ